MTALLTTLIPAYKPDHLGEVFASLQRQSWQDFRVIVSDDSPDAQITRLIRDGRFGRLHEHLHLTVVRGPGNARRNHERLIDLWAGQTPLVHLLMDDDIVFPDFYRTHLAAHAAADIGASITPRWLSQADGRPAWSLPLPEFITSSPLHHITLTPEQLFQSTLPSGSNWLGELSHIVLSASAAQRFPRPPQGCLNYYGLMDISALLEAGSHQPLVFIRECQGVFRQHGEQNTRSRGSHGHRVAMLVWAAMALHAWTEGRLSASQTVQAVSTAVQRCLALYGETDEVMNRFYALVSGCHGLAALHGEFSRFWLALLASHPSTAPAEAARAGAPTGASAATAAPGMPGAPSATPATELACTLG